MAKDNLVHNTISNIFFRTIIMAVGIVTTPIIVNSVGNEKFAFIVLASAITGYFSLFGVGIPGAIVKYVAEFNSKNDDETVNRIINSTLFLFALIGLLIALTIIVIVNLNGLHFFNISLDNYSSAVNVLYIASFIALFSWPSSVFKNALEGLHEFHKVNIINTVTRIIGVSLTIVSALLNYSVEIIFIAANSGIIISWFWQYWVLKRRLPYFKISFRKADKKTLKLLISFSLWLLLMQIAGLLIYQTDKIIVGVMLPVSMLTFYFVLFKPVQVIKTIISFFRAAIMPAASSRFSTSGNEGVKELVFKANKYYNAFLAPLGIIGIFLSESFIRLWMGNEYTEYIYITQIYCGTLLIIQSNGFLGEIYYGTGKVSKLAILSLVQAFINVALSVLFVKYIGLPGVLLGTIVTEILGVFVQYYLIFDDLNINKLYYLKNVVFKGQISSILFGIVLIPLWSYVQTINSWVVFLLVGSILLFLFYSFVYLFVIEKEDKQRISLNYLMGKS